MVARSREIEMALDQIQRTPAIWPDTQPNRRHDYRGVEES